MYSFKRTPPIFEQFFHDSPLCPSFKNKKHLPKIGGTELLYDNIFVTTEWFGFAGSVFSGTVNIIC